MSAEIIEISPKQKETSESDLLPEFLLACMEAFEDSEFQISILCASNKNRVKY